MSIAITAFDRPRSGAENALPVDTYTAWRLGSTVIGPQMPAPEGPRNLIPASVFRSEGSSGIVYVFQISLPVAASSTATRPRIVQHR